MDFLQREGLAIGCYTSRFTRQVNAAREPLEKTFCYSYWRSLADLERWAEFHPAPVAIFGTFMHIVQALQFQLQLRLFHEVSVLKAHDQDYVYINCHSSAGVLNAIT